MFLSLCCISASPGASSEVPREMDSWVWGEAQTSLTGDSVVGCQPLRMDVLLRNPRPLGRGRVDFQASHATGRQRSTVGLGDTLRRRVGGGLWGRTYFLAADQ